MSIYNEKALARFWGKVGKSADENTCWLWTAGTGSHGYGVFGIAGKMYLAHRLAYEICKGPILPGLVIRHDCDVRRCCNPNHLQPGTHQDNARDAVERKRFFQGPVSSLSALSRPLRADNTSGARGVWFEERMGKWRAKITEDRTQVHLGSFDTKEEAQAAYERRKAQRVAQLKTRLVATGNG